MHRKTQSRCLALIFALLLTLFAPTVVGAEGDETEAAPEPKEIHIGEGQGDAVRPLFEERAPLSVVINNHVAARPQSGLDKAKVIFELLTEGGITRYLLLTDADEGTVGPIRSARPAFFELAAEYKGPFCYIGNSEYVMISEFANYMKPFDASYSGGSNGSYYRTTHRVAPHNLYGDYGKIYEAAVNERGYETKLDEPLTQFLISEKPVDRAELAAKPEVEDVDKIVFSYSSRALGVGSASEHDYAYDAEREVYLKYTDGEVLTEEQTGEIVPVKNIIFLQLPHALMQNGEHWRIFYNSQRRADGTLVPHKGTLVTGGKAYPIEYTKEAYTQPMKFTMNGEPLVLDEGLTFVQVLPMDAPIKFSNEK